MVTRSACAFFSASILAATTRGRGSGAGPFCARPRERSCNSEAKSAGVYAKMEGSVQSQRGSSGLSPRKPVFSRRLVSRSLGGCHVQCSPCRWVRDTHPLHGASLLLLHVRVRACSAYVSRSGCAAMVVWWDCSRLDQSFFIKNFMCITSGPWIYWVYPGRCSRASCQLGGHADWPWRAVRAGGGAFMGESQRLRWQTLHPRREAGFQDPIAIGCWG